MTPRLHARGDAARAALLAGMAEAAAMAAVTLGPEGRRVLVARHHGPPLLRDGVGALRALNPADPFAALGTGLARQVAVEVSDLVGDGTSTAVLLFHALASGGARLLAAGLDAASLCTGVAEAVAAAIAALRAAARPLPPGGLPALAARIAEEPPEIGALLAEALERAGPDGQLTIIPGRVMAPMLRPTPGYELPWRGLAGLGPAPGAAFEDAHLLLSLRPLEDFSALVPLLERAAGDEEPLLILAPELGPEVREGLHRNRREGRIAAALLPGAEAERAARLADAAALTGATLLDDMVFDLADAAGRAARVEFGPERLLVHGAGPSPRIAASIALLRRQLARTATEAEREALRRRIALLSGRCFVLEAGGATPPEAAERRDRLAAAARAAQAALAGGVVPGGGLALTEAAALLPPSIPGDAAGAGRELVRAALRRPARRLGPPPPDLLDPAEVLATALRVAGSAAAAFLRTEVALASPHDPYA